jgi:hypothetical protein
MKPREHSIQKLGREAAAGRPVTRELGIDDDTQPGEEIDLGGFDGGDTGGRPQPIGAPMQTAQVDVARDRRVTSKSAIPAQLAEAMLSGAFGDGSRAARDPAAPELPEDQPRDPGHDRGQGQETSQKEGHTLRGNDGADEDHHTRRLGDSDRQPFGGAARPEASAASGIATYRQRAAALIDEARAALDEGNLTAAVTAAEGALHESDEAPPPGLVEVIEPARPLLARVFAAYVGPLGGVPVLAPRADEIARVRLGDREREIVGRIDGTHTLEQLFDGSGVGSTDVLRIAARLIRAGAIRVI